ncbi:unnamed protein product [Amoebophrya sp. A120]|nr:unnamed protein product [Amoebophrya sp. A120]|eukprot:GSA120T00006888001.1
MSPPTSPSLPVSHGAASSTDVVGQSPSLKRSRSPSKGKAKATELVDSQVAIDASTEELTKKKKVTSSTSEDIKGTRPHDATLLPSSSCHKKTPLVLGHKIFLKRHDDTSSRHNEATSPPPAFLQIYYKLDALQPSGSFKIRGIGLTVQKAKYEESCTGCVCSSGGNAGLACAYACYQYNLGCTIILPKTTPIDIARPKLLEVNPDVEIRIFGNVWNEANEEALRLVRESENVKTESSAHETRAGGTTIRVQQVNMQKLKYIHPFEGDNLYEGHSSVVDEILEQLPGKGENLKAIITACGGGGLATGILHGLEKHKKQKGVKLFIGETVGADCFYQSCLEKKPVTLKAITSVAKSLGSLNCEKLYRKVAGDKDHSSNVYSFRVTDHAAVKAAMLFRKRVPQVVMEEEGGETRSKKLCPIPLVEPACGAALALIDTEEEDLAGLKKTDEEGRERTTLDIIRCSSSTDSTDECKLKIHDITAFSDILQEGGDVVVEVCGGRMASEEMMKKWCKELGVVFA